jgi:hypothetical protein
MYRLDPSDPMSKEFENQHFLPLDALKPSDMERLSKTVPPLDTVICKDFIDHIWVADRPLFVQNMLKLLKPRGKLAFTIKMISPYASSRDKNAVAPVAGHIGWAPNQTIGSGDYTLTSMREDKSEMRLVGEREEQAFIDQIKDLVKDLPAKLISTNNIIDLGSVTGIYDRYVTDGQKNTETDPGEFATKKAFLDGFTGTPYSPKDELVITDFMRFCKWMISANAKGLAGIAHQNAHNARNCHRLHPDVWLCLKMPLVIASRFPQQSYDSCMTGIVQYMYCVCPSCR